MCPIKISDFARIFSQRVGMAYSTCGWLRSWQMSAFI